MGQPEEWAANQPVRGSSPAAGAFPTCANSRGSVGLGPSEPGRCRPRCPKTRVDTGVSGRCRVRAALSILKLLNKSTRATVTVALDHGSQCSQTRARSG
jgi:hypothetical protein